MDDNIITNITFNLTNKKIDLGKVKSILVGLGFMISLKINFMNLWEIMELKFQVVRDKEFQLLEHYILKKR